MCNKRCVAIARAFRLSHVWDWQFVLTACIVNDRVQSIEVQYGLTKDNTHCT